MTSFDPTLVHEFLTRNARRTPDKTALVFGEERWTYAALDAWSDRLAKALLAAGLRRQDRVVIFLDNCPQAVIAIYGVLKAGGVFVMINGAVKGPKLRYIMKNSGARFLITYSGKAPVVGEALEGAPTGAPEDCQVVWIGEMMPGVMSWNTIFAGCIPGQPTPEYPAAPELPRTIDIDLATLIYTSGSTGEPKGVMSTHHNMVAAARAIIQYLENREDDVVLVVLPLSFDYGLYQVLMAFIYGGTIVLEQSFLFLQKILERIVRERVTSFPIVPTVLAMLLRFQNFSDYDFSSLRTMTNTGAALPVEHIRKLREAFPHIRFYSMFGLTECKRVCYLPPEELDRRPGSVGKAMPGCEVRVVDDAGNDAAPGAVGELVVRGANVMQGYWRDPELTARVYRPGRYPGERLLYSGDLFRMDEEGYLYFLGRKDDMIKSRGERISPREVENILCELPGVAEAAVIGVPDPILGQAIRAYIVPAPEFTATARDVQKYCTERMEPFMVPKTIEIVNDLPRTANGKIDKKALTVAAGDNVVAIATQSRETAV